MNLKRHAKSIFYHRELTGIEITEHEAVNKVVVFISGNAYTASINVKLILYITANSTPVNII